MKIVIKEYAGTVMALIGTCLYLCVLGGLMFQKEGLLAKVIGLVLEGGV